MEDEDVEERREAASFLDSVFRAELISVKGAMGAIYKRNVEVKEYVPTQGQQRRRIAPRNAAAENRLAAENCLLATSVLSVRDLCAPCWALPQCCSLGAVARMDDSATVTRTTVVSLRR